MKSQFFVFSWTNRLKMFRTLLILSAVVAVAFAKIRSCDRGTPGPDPVEIRITGCNNNEVCRIVRGRDILGQIDFVATTVASSLEPEITAYAFGIRAVYELPADRQIGCNWIDGTSCPLDRGEIATYNLLMPVIDEYPLTKLDIEIRLFDQNRNIQFCVLVESEVVLSWITKFLNLNKLRAIIKKKTLWRFWKRKLSEDAINFYDFISGGWSESSAFDYACLIRDYQQETSQ